MFHFSKNNRNIIFYFIIGSEPKIFIQRERLNKTFHIFVNDLYFQVSEEDLPDCRARQVCSKVDLYDSAQPWIERKCRCLGHRPCSR